MKKFWNFIIDMKVTTFIVALCTLGTLIVIFCQLQTMRRQMVNDTRAWVTVENAFHNPFKENERAAARIVLINTGNSPALNITAHTEVGLRNVGLPTPMPINQPPNKLRSKSIMGPQVRHNTEVATSIPLTKQHIQAISTGEMHLYVWGRIEYDDIFNERRITEFCVRSKSHGEKFEACENNNTAN